MENVKKKSQGWLKKQLAVRLSEDSAHAVEAFAKKRGISVSDLIREALSKIVMNCP